VLPAFYRPHVHEVQRGGAAWSDCRLWCHSLLPAVWSAAVRTPAEQAPGCLHTIGADNWLQMVLTLAIQVMRGASAGGKLFGRPAWAVDKFKQECQGNKYSTTISAINSAIIKLSTQTNVNKVYSRPRPRLRPHLRPSPRA
jgi:hypothetical protein